MKTNVSQDQFASEQVAPFVDHFAVQLWTSALLTLYGAANFLGGSEFLAHESSQTLH